MTAKNPIIVALDVGPDEALKLAEKLKSVVGAVKIGSALFTAAGPQIVQEIRKTGMPVFLDLKWHDIPNTVALAVANAVKSMGVQMMNVHTSGGIDMMRAAVKAASETADVLQITPPFVIGVTVLTSLDDNTMKQVGFDRSVKEQVEKLAGLAIEAGLGGLVCSPLEVEGLRKIIPANFQLVVPGIRLPGAKDDDQARKATPKTAMDAGADWLVIGRPIYGAEYPVKAAEQILASLS